MPLALLLIPMIPALLQFIQKLIEMARGDPELPEETAAQLAEASAHLNAAAAVVAAVEIRDV